MFNTRFSKSAVTSGILLATAGILIGSRMKARRRSSFFKTADKIITDFKDLVDM